MKVVKSCLSLVVFTLILTLSAGGAAAAPAVDDAHALAGLERGKIVFDINLKDAPSLALYLKVIHQTHGDLVRQGVTPEIVLAFRGLAVTLIQHPQGAEKAGDAVVQVGNLLTELKALGVRMEACNVATQLFNVPRENLLPGVELVGNTFISLMGYQHQGFALVPIM